MKSFVAVTKIETMAFKEIETVLENYLQLRKMLFIAEQLKLFDITKKNGESPGDFLARLLEAAGFCGFRHSKTIANVDALQRHIKLLEHIQQNPDVKIDEILLFIQRLKQTVHFVNKEDEPNETVTA